MRHKPQNSFLGISFGIPQNQNGYLIYVPSTQKIISSHDVFLTNKSSVLKYTSNTYSDTLTT